MKNNKIIESDIETIQKDYNQRFGQNLSLEEFKTQYFPTFLLPTAVKRYEILRKYIIGNKILDAGCGTGWADFLLASEGFKVTAIDLSDKSLEKARKIKDLLGFKTRFVKDDLEELSFKDNAFDSALSFDVLEHIPDLDKALSEMRRVLKPKGMLVASFPNKYGVYCLVKDYFMDRFIWKILGKDVKDIRTYHLNIQCLGWWLKKFRKNGFKPVCINNTEFISPIIPKFAKKIFKGIISADIALSKKLPKLIASQWVFVLQNQKNNGAPHTKVCGL